MQRFKLDEKWETYEVVKKITEQAIPTKFPMIKDTEHSNVCGKRKREDMVEDLMQSIFTQILQNMDEFMIKLFIMTVDENFRIKMATRQNSPEVMDVMMYYNEFCQIVKAMDYEYNRGGQGCYQRINDILNESFYHLAINYFQMVQLFMCEH